MRRVLQVVLVGLAALAVACEPPGYGRHKPDGGSSGADAGPADAAVDAAAAVCHHSFRLAGYGTASSVWLTGDFVQWAPDTQHGAIAFTLGADQAWTGEHDFTAGTYQYKFIVNGSQWIPDPDDPNTVPDGLGGMNSVYQCVP